MLSKFSIKNCFSYFFKKSSYRGKRNLVILKQFNDKFPVDKFMTIDFSVEVFIEQIKKHERKYPHSFTYIVLVLIILAGIIGFDFGDGLDINVPPKEVAYVAGAIIAGLVGFLINESNKESEIGKHREKWLSELKGEVAIYFSDIEEFCYRIRKNIDDSFVTSISYHGNEKLFNDLRELKRSINNRYNKISLFVRTNKDKPERRVYEGIKSVKEKVDEVDGLIELLDSRSGHIYYKKVNDKIKLLIAIGMKRNILLVKEYCDDEWLYIKKGHVSFRLKRAFILSAILFIITAFSGYTISYYDRWA